MTLLRQPGFDCRVPLLSTRIRAVAIPRVFEGIDGGSVPPERRFDPRCATMALQELSLLDFYSAACFEMPVNYG